MAGEQHISSFETKVLMPSEEEAIPVRITDLQHLKRDIRAIPDGQGKFDNAFWGFLGLGAPFVLQYAFQPDYGSKPVMYIGCVLVIVALVFKAFGWKARTERADSIHRIMENINDCSGGELTGVDERPSHLHELWNAIIARIAGTSKTHGA